VNDERTVLGFESLLSSARGDSGSINADSVHEKIEMNRLSNDALGGFSQEFMKRAVKFIELGKDDLVKEGSWHANHGCCTPLPRIAKGLHAVPSA
jgi:hypothetical protein